MSLIYKILFLSFVLVLSNALGQGKLEKIKDIEQKIYTINQDTSYQVLKLRNEEFLDHMTYGGGQLTGLLKNGKIFKIIEWVGLSNCIKTFDYYFWNEQLICVDEIEKDFQWMDSIGGFDYNKTEFVFERHSYFDDKKLIESTTSGRERIPDNQDVNIEEELLSSSQQYSDLLSKKK